MNKIKKIFVISVICCLFLSMVTTAYANSVPLEEELKISQKTISEIAPATDDDGVNNVASNIPSIVYVLVLMLALVLCITIRVVANLPKSEKHKSKC